MGNAEARGLGALAYSCRPAAPAAQPVVTSSPPENNQQLLTSGAFEPRSQLLGQRSLTRRRARCLAPSLSHTPLPRVNIDWLAAHFLLGVVLPFLYQLIFCFPLPLLPCLGLRRGASSGKGVGAPITNPPPSRGGL